MLHVCISSLPIFTKPVWTWRPMFGKNQRRLDIFDLYSFYQLAFSSWKQKIVRFSLIFSSFLGETFQMIRSKSNQSTELSMFLWIMAMIWESNMIVFIHWSNFRIQGKIFFSAWFQIYEKMSFWSSKKLKLNLQEPSFFALFIIFLQFSVNCLTVDCWFLFFLLFWLWSK